MRPFFLAALVNLSSSGMQALHIPKVDVASTEQHALQAQPEQTDKAEDL